MDSVPTSLDQRNRVAQLTIEPKGPILLTSEVVPHVPARSAPIDADASTKGSEIFHGAGRSALRTTRRHICACIGLPTTPTRPSAAVTECCTTIRFLPERCHEQIACRSEAKRAGYLVRLRNDRC
jgi:hypothetical protein